MAKNVARWIELNYTGDNVSTNPTDALWAGNVAYSTTQSIKAKIDSLSFAATLDDLTDVAISSPASTQYLRYNGSAWVNSAIQAADLPTGIDVVKIGAGSVDNTEFGYLNGVTSAIQTQLDGKAPISINLDYLSDVVITSAASGEYIRYNGTNWVDASIQAADLPTGIDAVKIGSGTVDNTEFGYLNGTTSNIQTQLDGKASTTHTHAIDDLSDVVITSAANTQVLQFNGTNWVNASLAAGHTQNTDTGTTSDTFTVNSDSNGTTGVSTLQFGSTGNAYIEYDESLTGPHFFVAPGEALYIDNLSIGGLAQPLETVYGGTGAYNTPTNGQILVGKASDNTFVAATLGVSGNLAATTGAGTLSIGVASGYQIPTTTQVSAFHTQNTDFGTTSNTFTIDTDSNGTTGSPKLQFGSAGSTNAFILFGESTQELLFSSTNSKIHGEDTLVLDCVNGDISMVSPVSMSDTLNVTGSTSLGEAYVLYDLTVSGTIGGDATNIFNVTKSIRTETIDLTSTDITNKYVALSGSYDALNNVNVMLFVANGPAQIYGVDYTLVESGGAGTGYDRISWSTLGMDGVATSDDTLIVLFQPKN